MCLVCFWNIKEAADYIRVGKGEGGGVTGILVMRALQNTVRPLGVFSRCLARQTLPLFKGSDSLRQPGPYAPGSASPTLSVPIIYSSHHRAFAHAGPSICNPFPLLSSLLLVNSYLSFTSQLRYLRLPRPPWSGQQPLLPSGPNLSDHKIIGMINWCLSTTQTKPPKGKCFGSFCSLQSPQAVRRVWHVVGPNKYVLHE